MANLIDNVMFKLVLTLIKSVFSLNYISVYIFAIVWNVFNIVFIILYISLPK